MVTGSGAQNINSCKVMHLHEVVLPKQGHILAFGEINGLAWYVCLPDHLMCSFELDNDFCRTNAFLPD